MSLYKASLLGALLAVSGFATPLQKRDSIDCVASNQVAYTSANSLLSQIDHAVNNNDDFQIYGGQNGAFEYSGAYLTYCNYGYGNSIQAHIAGQYLLETINTCWTQQGQNNNLKEAGQYIMYEGPTLAGYLCVSNAKNPKSCNC